MGKVISEIRIILFIISFNFLSVLYSQQWQFANGPYEATLNNISIDQQNPDIIYTVGEGVFRSTDQGSSWIEIDPDIVLRSNIEPVIKADPINSGIVYYGGHGALFKSYDFGDNWEIKGFENRSVTSIEIDSVNPDIVYVGLKNSSDDAIWKSTDGGETWEKKTDGIPVHQIPIQNCKAIKINPLNQKFIITAISFEGVFKSVDSGNTWECIFDNNNPANDIEIVPWDTTTILAAFDGIYKSTDNGLTWALISNLGANCIEIDNLSREIYAGIYKSTDEGDTWISILNPELSNSFSLSTNIYDIKTKHRDDNILYIATSAGVYKSSNNGVNWLQSFNGLVKFFAYNIRIAPSNSSIIYSAGREGIHKSNDRGKSWKYIGGEAAENFIAIDPENSDIVYIAQIPLLPEYWLWRTTDGGNIWEKKFTSLTRLDFIEFDPSDHNTIYTKYTNTVNSGLSKSTDKGETWELINTPSSPTSILISKKNSLVIYIGSFNGVYKTINGGLNWTYLGLSENNSNIIISFAPEDENIIYASVYGAGIFRTTNDGLNWEELNNGLTSKNISVFTLNPKKINEYYVGTNDSGIYFTSNGGTNWNKLTPQHPSLFIDAICIDTTGNGKILAAGRNAPGIYMLDLDLTNIEKTALTDLPNNFILYQNYPNPFNESTIIKFFVPHSGNIKLEIFDNLGNKIKTLINGYMIKGAHSIEWNGENARGKTVSTGIYFFRLLNSNMSLNKKMIFLK